MKPQDLLKILFCIVTLYAVAFLTKFYRSQWWAPPTMMIMVFTSMIMIVNYAVNFIHPNK